jgi:NAD(P)-dependent dehydrogenase (short-subunit alcohol dehydrogenase family)
MELRLEGKTALITGGSRGIGLAIGQAMAAAGANVMLSSRKADGLEAAAATIEARGGSVGWVVAHVARPEEAEAAVAATMERFGAVDILVNNAGTNPYFGPMIEIDQVRMAKTYEINQASIVLWSQAAWRAWMADHGGVILNIASIGGLGPEPGIGWYNVSKAAVIHTTRQLAFELAPSVRVNAISPGLVKTELARALWETNEEAIAARLPLRRLGEVEDIASAALFLASDAASWITGQNLVIDGGTTNQATGGVS